MNTNYKLRMALRDEYSYYAQWIVDNLNYTVEQLRKHFEKQFIDGMNWEVFFKGDIHIDHIIPKCEFDLSRDDGGAQVRKCWCLSNIRPVWKDVNQRKSWLVETLL